LFTSGQIPLDPISGLVVGNDIVTQTKQVIKNLGEVLESAELTLDHVVKTTCFLADMDSFSQFNEIYMHYFPGKPARSCVEVSRLPQNVLIEIEAVAIT